MPNPLTLLRLNKVLEVGRLVVDPEVRYSGKGTAVCNFRIAVDAGYFDKDKHEWVKDASFFNVVAFNETAERMGERLRKGSAVLIEGSLKSRTYTDKADETKKHYVVEIVAQRFQFLEKASSQAQGGEESGDAGASDYEDPFET